MKLLKEKVLSIFFINQSSTLKKDIRWKNVVVTLSCAGSFMTLIALFKPEQDQRKFLETLPTTKVLDRIDEKKAQASDTATKLWQAPSNPHATHSQHPKLNTRMVVSESGANSHLQFGVGTKIKIRTIEKVITSQDPTPIIAITVDDVQTESGQLIPKGSQLYGEASYISATDRAKISFKQLAFPNGKIKDLNATVSDTEGNSGLPGDIHSDGLKNTAGQMITTFVGGMAEGSVARDFMGQSRGGITNGILSAVADTAKNGAERYAEKLKQQREWIEISDGTEGYAVLSQNLKMIEETSNNE